MKAVWKFEFEIDDNIEIEMPVDAEILYVDIQIQRRGSFMDGDPPTKEVPCIWARADLDRPKVKRKFRLAGTGHPLPDMGLQHLGSFKMSQDWLVFHLFEAV